MNKKYIYIVVFIIVYISQSASASKLDSLQKEVNRIQIDSNKVSLLIAISTELPAKDTAGKLDFALQALAIAKKNNSPNQLVICYEHLGNIYGDYFKDYQKSLNYFLQMEEVAVEQKNVGKQIAALNKIFSHYMFFSEYAKALNIGNEILALDPPVDQEINVLSNLGVIYQNVGDYTRAMEYYTRSMRKNEQLLMSKKSPDVEDTLQMAGLCFVIGDIYNKMRDWEKAIENYDKAIALGRRLDAIVIAASMGKGLAYIGKRDYTSALNIYKNALSAATASKDYMEVPRIMISLAEAEMGLNNYLDAQLYTDSALILAKKYSNQNILPSIYLILGAISAKVMKYPQSISYYKQAIELAGKNEDMETEREGWLGLSISFEENKNPEKAFGAYKNYISIRDSMYNIEKAKAVSRMDIESIYYNRRISDSVKNMQQTALYDARIQKQKILNRSAYGGVVLLILLSFFIYRNYSQQRKANLVISSANVKIADEMQRSEALLLNILPDEVAKELKEKGDVQPKVFDNVTVLFTDFVNFTIAGSRMTPQDLIAELHNCFSAFDLIIDKYKIEKIKTVGDAYIAVSGLPQPNSKHAEDTVSAALEIRDFMTLRKKELKENTFDVRIGVNSGQVVAGIVGVKKFAYDIWGDTVNVAARMEQHGEDGKVNISEKTYALVKDKFVCTERGKLTVKNKGEMDMYFVD